MRVQVELNDRDNIILASLPSEERKRLEPMLERAELESSKVLIEPDEPIRYIYFPIDLVTFTLQDLKDGSTVETGLMHAGCGPLNQR